jgi:glycosyltransferase involved in cell wall biosynthesis
MNILIINHYAGNPTIGMAYRPYYLAKEFIKMGHNVSILGASFSHLRNIQPKVNKDLSEDRIDGITYFWIKTPAYKGDIQRIINILVFIFKLYYYKKKISRITCPDVVIASSTYPLDIYPSEKISKISKAKLCFEVHDLWPLSPMVIGNYSKYHPYIYVLQMAENYAYKHSDIVVSLLGNAKEYMVNHGLDPNKFVHIPNGFDRKEFEEMQEDIPYDHFKMISDLKNNGNIIIGYTGGHGPSNAMNVLVDTAEIIKYNKKIVIISVGNGPSKNELQLIAKNLKNILFLPPVPKKSIQKLLALFDILYVGFVKSEIHKFGISPNKLIDYMLAAKPIILSADVENEIVEKVNCGITVSAEDPLSVHDAINKILNLTDTERLEMGLRGRNYAFKELGYKELAERFIISISSFLNPIQG